MHISTCTMPFQTATSCGVARVSLLYTLIVNIHMIHCTANTLHSIHQNMNIFGFQLQDNKF